VHQWSKWEAVFSTRSVRQLREATVELLGEVFSVRSKARCYKQDKPKVQLILRQSPANKLGNTEGEEAMALEAVTRRQQVKIQQTEKLQYVL
jgi:hypothetical protein